MANKIMTLSEAVKKYVKDRSMIAMGGFPMARQTTVFCKEILRQKRAGTIKVNDLFWVEPGIGFGGSMLVAEGIIESVISTFAGHGRPGLSKITRDSLEKGIPRKIKWEDETNLTLNLKFMAGALNMPFIPSSSGVWGDVRKPGLWDKRLPYQKNVLLEDPYGSGKKVALLQALNPDVAVVHVPFADEKGNGIILGSVYHDFWIGRSGKEIILIADQIVDTEACQAYPNLVAIPGAGVSAVVPWYMGAWPTNSPGLYGEDLEHMVSFIKTCGDRKALEEYLEKYVYSWETHEDYLKLIGNKAKLEDNPANVLGDPFKQWIKK